MSRESPESRNRTCTDTYDTVTDRPRQHDSFFFFEFLDFEASKPLSLDPEYTAHNTQHTVDSGEANLEDETIAVATDSAVKFGAKARIRDAQGWARTRAKEDKERSWIVGVKKCIVASYEPIRRNSDCWPRSSTLGFSDFQSRLYLMLGIQTLKMQEWYML
jgi:hypothetical protein